MLLKRDLLKILQQMGLAGAEVSSDQEPRRARYRAIQILHQRVNELLTELRDDVVVRGPQFQDGITIGDA